MKHGGSAYNRGCRCVECKAAVADRQREYRQKHKEAVADRQCEYRDPSFCPGCREGNCNLCDGGACQCPCTDLDRKRIPVRRAP